MPAKTVKDLIDFNNSVPDKFKVKIQINSQSNKYLSAKFIGEDGQEIDQRDVKRIEYYGKAIGRNVEPESEHGFIRYIDPDNKPMYPYGYVSCKANELKSTYQCHNAWFIGSAEVAKGYGPLLYDCLLAKLGEKNLGLTTDRKLVSPLAAKVWVEYLTNRPDVRKEPLDFNNSTPQTEDDCFAYHKEDPNWNAWLNEPKKSASKSQEEYEKKKEDYRLMGVAVKWAYFDDGIKTLDELKKAGLIVENIAESYSSLGATKELLAIYSSLLKEVKK